MSFASKSKACCRESDGSVHKSHFRQFSSLGISVVSEVQDLKFATKY